jgi:hypothetical protein
MVSHRIFPRIGQQWNFSSPGSVREIEDYAVELSDVTVLELIIVPDQSGGAARALASLRLVCKRPLSILMA